MVDRFAQPNVRSVAHGDDVRLSAAFGNWCGTRQCPEPLIVTGAERPRTFGEQCSEVDPADTGYRFENRDVLPLKAFSRRRSLANRCAERIQFMLGLSQLAIDNAQASDKRAHVDAGRFGNAIRNFDGRFSQCTKNGLSIHATDAMLLE